MSSEFICDLVPTLQQPLVLRLPSASRELDQDQEWCEIQGHDGWQRIRFHDYAEIYRVPGLYEALFYDRLQCCSPARVVGLLEDVLADTPDVISDMRVLDVGAGNGIVGETLRRAGVAAVVGADIIPEARAAAQRDRPGLYDDYIVGDLRALGAAQLERMQGFAPNCLTTVAALGYGDIPADVFIAACNLVSTPAWLAFNIKESFLDQRSDRSGLALLLTRMQERGLVKVHAYRRYRHRLSVAGEPLHYVAIVAQKLREIPTSITSD